MEKLMKRLRKKHKGFSLVELIIVIVIMAILIGIIGLAVIPYIEKGRVSKDKQTVDSVYSAFSTAIASTEGITADFTIVSGTAPEAGTATTVNNATIENLGITVVQAAGKLVSKSAKDKTITMKYTYATNKIEVYATGDTDIASANQ